MRESERKCERERERKRLTCHAVAQEEVDLDHWSHAHVEELLSTCPALILVA